MKVQYLAVIFVIIIIPISFVMAQYIQTQITSIELQSAYTASLITATSDALTAFQINSINNKYSSLSDSKIRDIEASINTFYKSLGSSMDTYIGAKQELELFVPAMLYTLYDGYYIYSSYNNIYSADEGQKPPIKDDNNYQAGLRPYIYYSAKYKLANGNIIVVNYTLDNAITIYGDVGDGNGYSTKSGYLINPNFVTNINTKNKTLTYNGVEIKPEVLKEHLMIIKDDEGNVEQGDYQYIVYKNKKVYLDNEKEANGDNQYFWYDNYKKTYLQSEKSKLENYLAENGVGFKSTSAFDYYYSAYNFSMWVTGNNYLKNLTQRNVVKYNEGETVIGDDTKYLSMDTGSAQIFDTTKKDNDPLRSDSIFNNHRMSIIRKSIETNLTTAIANYNIQSHSNYEFAMPVIDEVNWDKITNYVSLITFMQGLPMGTKYYNNYSVITNTKNEEVISDQSIFVLTEDENNIEYHRVGCKTLIDDNQSKISGAYSVLGIQRQTLKISESNIYYFYPQVRMKNTKDIKTMTGCYHCIVNTAGAYDADSIIKGEIRKFEAEDTVLYDMEDLKGVRNMYLTALARERYDLYKTNFDLND